ncbi:NAC domain-containing protein 68-like [Dendrobium catenatum]|uniref:NAC domain-containing protein 68 n=1 Tax=Dendrobium catenatum TaxID=906689 RepID=A0A2I0WKA0_9ASPA|nr:NAC domain-containing protein 68-like [Dendrobium catenatum]PKU76087.1 NAC domain-containing protein 68 [Dendrobium catenatum]
MGRSRDAEAELNLPPGFRFHPTDEELVVHYLCRRTAQQCLPVPIIAEVDLYKYNPWDLPDKAMFGTKEWYFFTPRDRKYPNGSRPNRAAGRGYWKATGADKPVAPARSGRAVGIKKALVFYDGKAPKGVKTDWIMHEYRLANVNRSAKSNGSLRLDDWVLCRLYNKKNNWEKMATSSMEENEDAKSESLRTPESGIEMPDLDEFGDAGFGLEMQVEASPAIKEDYDWYSDLNLGDLQSNLGDFQVPVVDFSNQDYFFFNFDSPKNRAVSNLTSF